MKQTSASKLRDDQIVSGVSNEKACSEITKCFKIKPEKLKCFQQTRLHNVVVTNKQNNIIVAEANNLERNVKYIFELKKKNKQARQIDASVQKKSPRGDPKGKAKR